MVNNVFLGTNHATYNASVIIPASAFNGTTRLRVRCIFSTNPASVGPCGSTSFGETEDYNITVTGGSAPGMPCGGSPFQLHAGVTGGGSPYTYGWSPSIGLSA